MGGGFAAPPIVLAVIASPAAPMHEKLLEKDETRKEKTDKPKLLAKGKDKPPKDKPPKEKPAKESKFAERLRRSFRRSEHKSLEIKRSEPTPDELLAKCRRATPPPASQSDNNNLVGRPLYQLKQQQQLHQQNSSSRASLFSLSQLPGLGLGLGLTAAGGAHGGAAGHYNPALLLDSPDECTPPEYAYQHLSSVATTNSSTSLESNLELGDLSGSQSSIYYWACRQSQPLNASMGGEVSTASGESQERAKRRLETQTSNRSDQQLSTPQTQAQAQLGSSTHASASRSCSLTSESSSVRLTRLQNFLFKSSNESSRSCQGHSNEGFTASSHNSSSGEWEQLGAYGPSSSSGGLGGGLDFHGGSFPEESTPDETDGTDAGSTLPVESVEAGSYYQYTLTSPNNPFLPEITARTYHSNYDDEPQEGAEELELDGNVTSVKYTGTRSAQLPTPAYSRAGSQESTHSESGISCPPGPTPSPASSSSSTPGRHRRKLFSLNSPTRLLHHQHHQPQQQPQNVAVSASPPDSSKFNSANLVRSLNPFLPVSSSAGSPRRVPLKQAAVTSPVAVPPDLSSKREEFLRATMKICLVVSPPSSKLQLKSKSLTHLDGLDTVVACQHGSTATTAAAAATATAAPNAAAAAATMTTTTTATAAATAALGRQANVTNKGSQLKQVAHTSTPTAVTRSSTIVQRKPSLRLSPTLATTSTAATTVTSVSVSCCAVGASSAHNSTTANGSCSHVHAHGNTYSHSHLNTPTIACSSSSSTSSSAAVQHSVTSKHLQFSGIEAIATSTAMTLSPALAYSATPAASSLYYYGATPTTTAAAAAAGSAAAPTTTMTTLSAKKKSTFLQRKKPLLTRSEVSSSEYFSVCFCTDASMPQDEEFIPATKGVTLLTALGQAMRRRNLSFSQITITDNNPTPSFLDAGPSPLTSCVDEQTEVENLAGHHLIITERDSSRKTLQKAASFGSRQRPPRLLSSASTEETMDVSNAAGKQIKQRWSSIFGVKNPQIGHLCELLNDYAKNGVPQRPDAFSFDHPELGAALDYLHNMQKSWRDFVDSDGMSDSEVKIQTAIWELVTTEVYYIHALQTVTDLFLACLESVQQEGLLTDVDQHRLFSNVRAVCEANIKFWTLWLYPMVAHSNLTREPMRCAFFQEGFIAFASIFAPYKCYCAEQSTCQFYCKELNHNNPLFTSYLAWCESQKMCNRLRLADIVVRPMQRLTKYSLLLAAIKKHMSEVDEIEAIDTMMHSVENFVVSVNNHLTMRQESERLKGVMARIESYDVIDTNNEVLDKMIKQHSQMFDLCAPMRGCPVHQVRHLFMEGDHKFKDNLGKADVHCFLLTDMLLVCKTIAKKGLGTLKVIRQPYLTDQLMVHLAPNNMLNCVYLNEFQVATTAFTLQCTEAKNWYDALWRAKTIYQRLKRGMGGNGGDSFRFGGSGASGGTADSLGVRKSPMNSSICSHVSSANNSHSGSVEWNDSRNISVDFEKTNSLSSDEGSSLLTGSHGLVLKGKQPLHAGIHKPKIAAVSPGSANTLSVQPVNSHLGQSLPNLNLHHSHTNLYHTYSNNTLLVPGTTTSNSGNLLLSPSHRGISYPPPSPTRVPLRRGMAFSTSTKNPPLLKTRNITSQNSINWHQIPATPTPPSPQSQHNSPGVNMQKSLPALITNDNELAAGHAPPLLQKQLSHQTPIPLSNHHHHAMELQRPLSNETDV